MNLKFASALLLLATPALAAETAPIACHAIYQYGKQPKIEVPFVPSGDNGVAFTQFASDTKLKFFVEVRYVPGFNTGYITISRHETQPQVALSTDFTFSVEFKKASLSYSVMLADKLGFESIDVDCVKVE